jgi:hypothetical protein
MSLESIDATFKEAAPLSMVERGVHSAREFDLLKASLLDPKRHINHIGGRDRVNAGGWQVIGAALGVRVEIISKTAHGDPGAYRELLEDAKGKKIVSFAVTVRATSGDRVQERMGRCDSNETKHAQYEHKLESVAITRAINRAVCAIVGGEPSDNAEEAEDEQAALREEEPEQQRQYSSKELMELYEKGSHEEPTFRTWLVNNIRGFTLETKKLTQEQSVIAYKKLKGEGI